MTTALDYLASAKQSIALGHKEIRIALSHIDAGKEDREFHWNEFIGRLDDIETEINSAILKINEVRDSL